MAVRTVIRMGHPVLRRVAEPVTRFDTPELHALVTDLWDTMHASGGIGIAAPQIAVARRVVVFGLGGRTDEAGCGRPAPISPTVLVNPVIEPLEDAMAEGWEACLSVPGMRGIVPRYTTIRYTGFDAFGNRIEREVEDYHARVVQHECDHLDGVLYPSRILDMSTFGFDEELAVEA
jgi:peptide deformylase